MPFEKVDTQVDFPAQEREVLAFWDSRRIFEQLRKKNANGVRWSFLDGPITANNPMGVHHAWGRTYKDAYQRYHAMLGQHQRYQNGFDCQGLWVEVEVEKELGLRSKRDIENLVPGDPFASMDRFVQLCKERVDRFARVQTEQSIRLGYWMDWDRTDEDWARAPGQRRSYFTMSEENNYTIWSFLKKCHARGLIYRGFDAMPWCPRCGVGLSEMEVKEGYKQVEHKSVFVKFPLRGRPGENLLVWTTTPWTLSSNVGSAVNPDLTYVKVRHKGEVYYVGETAYQAARSDEEEAADEVEVDVDRTETHGAVHRLKTIEQLFKEKGKEPPEVVGKVTGAEMVGWAYDGPFDELPAQAHPAGYPVDLAEVVLRQNWAPRVSAKDVHRVVAWNEVGATTGTGIVHIAPGCGKEDFHLGKEVGLPPVAPLDDAGVFLPGFGWLEGLSAVDHATADRILDDLKHKGKLFAVEIYGHSYPHCWRCKTELLFRLVDEWFINMSWRGEIMDVTRQVKFLPESLGGQARELKWLEQMGDWMISKKRFWGLALPIWVDEVTGEFEVIGSREELEERAVEGWQEFEGHTPHRPWVDKVKIRNPKTGNLMSRIADVGNPWLDAGIVPYSTMGYNTNRAEWQKWFPADFITESFPGQFRNWFYAILAMSTMMEKKPPFKVLLGHALVRDQHGETMAKTKGNAIEFNGAANDGYELFHERDPKVSVEQQAKRDLPKGWTSCSEGEVVLEGKRVQVVKGKYHPIGADVIRWLYCRSNPAVNINFGPESADDVRARFVLKLWNTYAFFCNLARIDAFDPTAPAVPLARRPDMDRWILSDLQQLVGLARESFESYNLMAFCLEAERFVDDRLSNWYVRRSKRRFYESGQSEDKLAAYQTLYEVLVTLTRLLAPALPFLCETMYQNLVVKGQSNKPGVPPSVHLCEYPSPDTTMLDKELSDDMDALIRLVSLGSAARNLVKIKVRQPLAEIRVQPANESDEQAVERFSSQLLEELNIKKVSLHDPAAGPLLRAEAKPNMKTLGPKFGARLQEVRSAILDDNPTELAARVQKGEPFELACPHGPVTLDPTDLVVEYKAPEGWAGVRDRAPRSDQDTQVAINTTITEELAREGMAREVVRYVNDLRKKAELELEDRITLRLCTTSERLHQAIQAHRDYIAGETLTTGWSQDPLDGQAHRNTVKVEGQELLIELRRVEQAGPQHG
jgi:isoleucyl-tRNA synthetase